MGEFQPGDHSSGPTGLPGRRSLLAAAAGLAMTGLAACAQQPVAAPAPRPATVSTPVAEEVGQLPVVPETAPPSRSQVVAEFSGRKPVEWGLAVAGVVAKTASTHAVLTFDACGGPQGSACDQPLLKTLRKLNVPATLFVNGRWIKANPGLAAELAADPLFELGNHGYRHQPLSVNGRSAYGIPGTANAGEVYDEIMGNQEVMERLCGKAPRFFRAGTAYYDDVAAAITNALGLVPVSFTVNGDGGATFPAPTVAGEVGKIAAGHGAGQIVISHFNQPAGGTAEGYARALPGLLDRGVTFARLGDTLPL
ncbi:polysaccharide deacetylase family protein [Arthrobacter sp. FW306-2-2C-D06B]|uniref:polysaccharide deacetylase family protein n=1 Tax=Arthrobacter sp. FW306-2-2C-D06B TaxID=2879618 RepID=UPI001F0316A7|nr:polysaccharide deacetylase family protein [Arthrobacter sp. FW306-2-2C-D06B]UKA57126.1 polysaccharide deacetylase family protein [Arthrobacter sp. FW306-2-2C-D06B]